MFVSIVVLSDYQVDYSVTTATDLELMECRTNPLFLNVGLVRAYRPSVASLYICRKNAGILLVLLIYETAQPLYVCPTHNFILQNLADNRGLHWVGQKCTPDYYCNNFVYCQPGFIIFGTFYALYFHEINFKRIVTDKYYLFISNGW